jgi:hypothetical protein
MNPVCKKPYTDDFIRSNVFKSFYNDKIKKKNEKRLYDIENSFLPATQEIIEQDIEIEKINKIIDEKRKMIESINIDIVELDKEKNKIRSRNSVEKQKKLYIRACPKNECRGFLSDKWNCSLCETDVCKDCHEIKQEDHVCDEATLETIKMMSKEVKNCPKCASQIYKIDGCDQMFCTQCQTVFSWKTLAIETGRVHNPHYYQWLRENNNGEIPREEGDDPCGGRARLIREATLLRKVSKISKDDINKLWNLYIAVNHIEYVEMNRNPVIHMVDINTNMDIRKKYMRNQITKQAFQSTLFKRDKAARKKNEWNNVFGLFVQVATEKINNLYNNNELIDLNVLINFYTEMSPFVSYINDVFVAIGEKYNCVYPTVNKEFQFTF